MQTGRSSIIKKNKKKDRRQGHKAARACLTNFLLTELRICLCAAPVCTQHAHTGRRRQARLKFTRSVAGSTIFLSCLPALRICSRPQAKMKISKQAPDFQTRFLGMISVVNILLERLVIN